MKTEQVSTKRIVVTSSAYEGDDFPEAEHYPEFLAKRLAEMYPSFSVEVTEGGYSTKAHVHGGDMVDERDLEREIESFAKADLWEEFCAEGYKAYKDVR